MNRYKFRPFKWALIFVVVVGLFTGYMMLDVFVIPQTYSYAAENDDETSTIDTENNDSGTDAGGSVVSSTAETDSSDAVITEDSYSDGNININIDTFTEYDTSIYVADIQVSSAEYLKAAFAEGTYGKNIKETTSDIADDNDAILAINGDYYGFRNSGYVVRNGVLYRNKSSGGTCLVIYSDGTMETVEEDDITAEELVEKGAWQVLSFGPTLLEDGEISVSVGEEVDQAMTSNPRTAIGMIDSLHYIFIVSDGRTDESAGLTLYQLSSVLQEYGCSVAYNLDGGGSSTMVFNGDVINNPTSGKSISEREVSDIVYIG